MEFDQDNDDDIFTMCEFMRYQEFIAPLQNFGISSIKGFLSFIGDQTNFRKWMSSPMYHPDGRKVIPKERNDFVDNVKDYSDNCSKGPSMSLSVIKSLPLQEKSSNVFSSLNDLANGGQVHIGPFIPAANSTLQNSPSKSFDPDSAPLTTTVDLVNARRGDVIYQCPFIKFENINIRYLVNPYPYAFEGSVQPDGSFNCFQFDLEKAKWEISPDVAISEWKEADGYDLPPDLEKMENVENCVVNPKQQQVIRFPMDFPDKLKLFAEEIFSRLGYVFPYQIRDDTLVELCSHLFKDPEDHLKLDEYYQLYRDAYPFMCLSPKGEVLPNVTAFLVAKINNKFKYKCWILSKLNFYDPTWKDVDSEQNKSEDEEESPRPTDAVPSGSNSVNLLERDEAASSDEEDPALETTKPKPGSNHRSTINLNYLLRRFPYDEVTPAMVKKMHIRACADLKANVQARQLAKKESERPVKKRKANKENIAKPTKKPESGSKKAKKSK